jgi:8-oxo-dGTP pyrophosphatase MutT (NUDIX family)
MPNSFVFPGGVLSPSADDHFPFFDERTNNVFVRAKTKEEEFRSLPKLITLGLASDHALRVCALRELFEESGLLPVILSPAGKTPSTADETPPHSQTAAKRILLNSGDDPKLHEWRLRV